MSNVLNGLIKRVLTVSSALFLWQLCQHSACANPTGGTVALGAASFNTSGSQETITTSANAYINWQSFNIAAGETTTFVQPSSSSVVWNNINGSSPSQILGNLNANGYVILQNQAGFYVGGQAAITAHGLIMTTAGCQAPNVSSGGSWEFDSPPPTAKIVNYGQINIAGGGSAFLIADDIENNGAISAPSGNIGLYAGEKVLVSMSPDGRGLSAEVTLPQGSVDNHGNLIADGGAIEAQAQTVNQNGLIQANSVKDVNGTIELVASDAVNLGANSVISAAGDSTSASPSAGGDVTIKSADTFSDEAGSTINISGGAQGGNGGQVEISAPEMNSLNSSINGLAAGGFTSGVLSLDPLNILLASSSTDQNAQYSGTVNPNDPPANGTLTLNVNDFSPTLSQINLQAINDIELSTVWNLPDPGTAAKLTLTAGNNIILDDGSAINAGNNWSVNLSAGAGFVPTAAQPTPASGNDGIYLLGSASIQTENGNINLSAANQVVVNWGSDAPNNGLSIDVAGINGNVVDALNSGDTGNNGIRTLNGGNISVTAQYGDIFTGGNNQGFNYTATAPYFNVSILVGGVSTAAGGNVTINAGGDVISYLPSGSDPSVEADAGSGAFGLQPGNVSVTAGGNIFGHYVLVNGVGTITAGDNVGEASGANPFALSLVSGTWNVNAPNGSIYLQEVRNPNGVFNSIARTSGVHSVPNPGLHLFDYAPDATVDLNAGIGVDLTGAGIPRPDGDVEIIYPPILNISTGSGGVTLNYVDYGNYAGDPSLYSLILFPSLYQNLDITTTGGGSFIGIPDSSGNFPGLLMSDSSLTSWTENTAFEAFSDLDNGSVLPVLSPNPVSINISGDMAKVNLVTSKATQISVGGDMIDCGFSGQNLNASDVSSLTVAGGIVNQSDYAFVNLTQTIPDLPSGDVLTGYPDSWNSIFLLAVNPTAIANLQIPAGTLPSQLAANALEAASLFGVSFVNGQLVNSGQTQGFVYNPVTGQLGYNESNGSLFPPGSTTSPIISELSAPLTILKLGANGMPETYTVKNPAGSTTAYSTYYETTTVSWGVSASALSTLLTESENSAAGRSIGYSLGGPGVFNVNAGSIDLGDSYGILSCGTYLPFSAASELSGRFADLASITPSGAAATLNVTINGDLTMDNSTIASLAGGNINLISTGGSLNLGSPYLNNSASGLSFGVFTTAGGDVNVTALGDVDVAGSRIGTFDGGNIFIESLAGNVNVGNGGDTRNSVDVAYVNPATGQTQFYPEQFYGSGILAYTLVPPTPDQIAQNEVPPADEATMPGNITVETPRGSITASLAGIQQEALDGSVAAGPVINLFAGSQDYIGNIDLGQSGVIGGTVNATATGSIVGAVVSRQNSNIQAQQSFVGTVLSGGTADVNAGGSVGGTIIGAGGANVSGGAGVTAAVLGQNVSVNGGATQSTLGSSATATSTSQSAAQQANSQAQQQVADNSADDSNDTDDKKKKKPALLQHIKRVTVILPKSV